MKNTVEKITLTEDQLLTLLNDKTLEGFEDFTAYADHASGSYDSEKGAMCDYDIFLINQKTNDEYVAKAGYYTGVTGDCFYTNVEFVLKRKIVKKLKPRRRTKTTKLSVTDIKKSLKILIKKNGGDIKAVKKVLSTIK